MSGFLSYNWLLLDITKTEKKPLTKISFRPILLSFMWLLNVRELKICILPFGLYTSPECETNKIPWLPVALLTVQSSVLIQHLLTSCLYKSTVKQTNSWNWGWLESNSQSVEIRYHTSKYEIPVFWFFLHPKIPEYAEIWWHDSLAAVLKLQEDWMK